MLVNYKLVLYVTLFVIGVLITCIYLKRRQRKYSSLLRDQVQELTHKMIDHVQKSRRSKDALLAMQESSYAYGMWDAVRRIVPEEDFDDIVGYNQQELTKRVRAQLEQCLEQLENNSSRGILNK